MGDSRATFSERRVHPSTRRKSIWHDQDAVVPGPGEHTRCSKMTSWVFDWKTQDLRRVGGRGGERVGVYRVGECAEGQC